MTLVIWCMRKIYLTHGPHFYQSSSVVDRTLGKTTEVFFYFYFLFFKLWLHQICTYMTKNAFVGKKTSSSASSDNQKNAEYRL